MLAEDSEGTGCGTHGVKKGRGTPEDVGMPLRDRGGRVPDRDRPPNQDMLLGLQVPSRRNTRSDLPPTALPGSGKP